MQIDALDCLLAGTLSMHRPEVGPLVHHPTIGKPAHAVLAARTLADLAFAPALGAEHDAGFASAHAPRGLMTSMATKINPIDRRISLSRFVSVFDAPLHGREAHTQAH